MSSFIPSTLRPSLSPSTSPSASSDSSPLLPSAAYTDCQTCRMTGTATFAAVGTYALTVARGGAKTQAGKGAASLLGIGFLVLAAGRWTAYTPPPIAGENSVAV